MIDILSALRSLMASYSPPLDALVVPSEDYHQSEYVSARDKRRQFVSGFTGSAGLALITMNDARLWTDGRYFLQAMQQLSDDWKLMRMGEDPAVDVWMADNLPIDAKIGVDPWCVSVDTARKWERAFAKKEQKLIQTSTNLVDEVAWLYNIRGSDVSYCPVVHAFAIVTSSSAFIYVDKRKVSEQVHSHMKEYGIEVRDYGAVISDVALLASNQLDSSSAVKGTQAEVIKEIEINSTREDITGDDKDRGTRRNNDHIWVDPGSCCYALYSKLDADKVIMQPSPLALAKALKNPVELDGLKKAHIRDGAAVVQFLVWLDTQHFRGLSFPTISSVGPNAAVIHYSPEAEKCAELDANSIYLFDSGAQYLDGTTDVTRTVHYGKPSAHEKACYTAVLKGHIGLGNARFPNGTTGHALDILARVSLWKDGLDYRHGTGHGVGSYLFVHEGPHLISFRPYARNVPLQASMTVTDEPGYYEDGSFGIRLENVLIIKEADTTYNFGDKGYLSFEHITWAPYQKKLIDLSLLNPEEVDWLNTYHSNCRDILAPYLDESEKAWLKKATEPVSL
ncbi:probable Xaa-Pro aminopeptidase P [Carica papaya]|uniref:probable Xaa-Pro aminopeptidase P n=1 Tax=Carica papaya TaxID=3649 RepID=UPI000B8CA160|nr:probable Xaa-Pro aminopeptidase P [Carica papaya]